MDRVFTVAWESLLQGIGVFAIGALLLGAITSRGRELAGGLWMIGWAFLLLTGALFIAEDAGYPFAGHLALLADGLFAPLMWMGAVESQPGRSAPTWPLAVGLAAGSARIACVALGVPWGEVTIGLSVAPGFLAGAAWVMARPSSVIQYRHVIAGLFAVLVVVEATDSVVDLRQAENLIQWRALISVCVPLAAFQMASRLMELRSGMITAQTSSDAIARELGHERWRFQAAFDHVSELALELSESGNVLFVNSRLRAMLGREPEEVVGRSLLEFVQNDERDLGRARFAEIVKRGATKHPIVVGVPHANGEVRYLECTMSVYAFPGERRVLAMCRDVTERHRAEERSHERERELVARVEETAVELRASLDRVREQERLAAVGTLASGLAHQINNPIGAISAAAEFALLTQSAEEGQQALVRIVEEAKRAGRIVRSSLGFARQGTTAKWSEDFGQLVRRTIEVVRPYVYERSGALELDLVSAQVPVRMSPIEIEQVVVNLVRNAAESRTSGVRIGVRTGIDGGRAILDVIDDGRGIQDEDRDQIFDPFFTTRLREGGTGIGLSVVRRILHEHDGTIEIESEPGHGTHVRVTLPLADRGEGEPERSPPRSNENGPEPRRGRSRSD